MEQLQAMKQATKEYTSHRELGYVLDALELKEGYMYLGVFVSYEDVEEELRLMGIYFPSYKIEKGDLKIYRYGDNIYPMLYVGD